MMISFVFWGVYYYSNNASANVPMILTMVFLILMFLPFPWANLSRLIRAERFERGSHSVAFYAGLESAYLFIDDKMVDKVVKVKDKYSMASCTGHLEGEEVVLYIPVSFGSPALAGAQKIEGFLTLKVGDEIVFVAKKK